MSDVTRILDRVQSGEAQGAAELLPLVYDELTPHDRRIVHLAHEGDDELKTMSRGEGLYKKVVVYPVKKKEGPEESPLT